MSDAVRGDEVFACIVAPEVGAEPEAKRALAEDLVAWCLARLAYYKAPGHVALVEALPMTASQKIQRGELRSLTTKLIAASTSFDTTALKKRQG